LAGGDGEAADAVAVLLGEPESATTVVDRGMGTGVGGGNGVLGDPEGIGIDAGDLVGVLESGPDDVAR